MPSAVPPSEMSNQPEEEADQKRKEVFSILAQAYNEGVEQGGVEEGLRRLRQKLDELFPRPYKERAPFPNYFMRGA